MSDGQTKDKEISAINLSNLEKELQRIHRAVEVEKAEKLAHELSQNMISGEHMNNIEIEDDNVWMNASAIQKLQDLIKETAKQKDLQYSMAMKATPLPPPKLDLAQLESWAQKYRGYKIGEMIDGELFLGVPGGSSIFWDLKLAAQEYGAAVILYRYEKNFGLQRAASPANLIVKVNEFGIITDIYKFYAHGPLGATGPTEIPGTTGPVSAQPKIYSVGTGPR